MDLPERTLLEVHTDETPKTTDIVFLVEAKLCNKDILASGGVVSIINEVNKKLNESGKTNNKSVIISTIKYLSLQLR